MVTPRGWLPRRRHLLSLALGLGLAAPACADAAPPPLPAPPIVDVAAWGGSAPSDAAALPTHRIRHITLHHQGEIFQPDGDVAAYLRRLQSWSRLSKRWVDIPYHYVVAPDGRIYAARAETLPGDTNTDYQPQGHALVMLLGNFEEQQPGVAQLRATAELMAWLASKHGLSVAEIASHRDYSEQTVCPGRHLYAYLNSGWLRAAVAAQLAGETVPAPY